MLSTQTSSLQWNYFCALTFNPIFRKPVKSPVSSSLITKKINICFLLERLSKQREQALTSRSRTFTVAESLRAISFRFSFHRLQEKLINQPYLTLYNYAANRTDLRCMLTSVHWLKFCCLKQIFRINQVITFVLITSVEVLFLMFTYDDQTNKQTNNRFCIYLGC